MPPSSSRACVGRSGGSEEMNFVGKTFCKNFSPHPFQKPYPPREGAIRFACANMARSPFSVWVRFFFISSDMNRIETAHGHLWHRARHLERGWEDWILWGKLFAKSSPTPLSKTLPTKREVPSGLLVRTWQGHPSLCGFFDLFAS